MDWASRVAKMILPLSKNTRNLSQALKEWYWSGKDNDIGSASGICGICGQPEIRYEFEIINLNTGKSLWVGSECIKKFELPRIGPNGAILSINETAKELDSRRRIMADEFKRQRAIWSLILLEKACDTLQVNSFISYLGKHEVFTPKQLNLLFWNFDKYRIEYFPRDFRVSLRKARDKEQILEMNLLQLNRIIQAMNPQQKAWLKAAKE